MGHSTDSGFVRTHRFLTRFGIVQLIEPEDMVEHRMPDEAANPGDVYATVDDDGFPKQITVYGDNREKLYDIDLDHDHTNGEYPNGHVQFYDAEGNRSGEYKKPEDVESAIRYIHLLKKGLAEDRRRGINYGYNHRRTK